MFGDCCWMGLGVVGVSGVVMQGAYWEVGRCEVVRSGVLPTDPESGDWVIFLQVALFFK